MPLISNSKQMIKPAGSILKLLCINSFIDVSAITNSHNWKKKEILCLIYQTVLMVLSQKVCLSFISDFFFSYFKTINHIGRPQQPVWPLSKCDINHHSPYLSRNYVVFRTSFVSFFNFLLGGPVLMNPWNQIQAKNSKCMQAVLLQQAA